MSNQDSDVKSTNRTSTSKVDVAALFADGRVIAAAVAAGVAAALRRHKAAGVPAYIWQNGQVVEIPPDQLPDDNPRIGPIR